MQNKLPLCGALLAMLAAPVLGQGTKKSPQHLPGDLLRQIDSFSPDASDPLGKAPASLSENGTSSRLQPGKSIATDASSAREAPPEKKPNGATEITAESVDFDQKVHQAVFTGRVTVKDPEFDLRCDKLTAVLKSEKTSAPADGAKPAADGAKKNGSGGLEKAIAEGHVVISQEKLDADGKVTRSTGRSARADYSAVTGEMVLSGNPEVQQGINTCVATDPATKMYMQRDGKMRVVGPSKIVIRDQGDSK